MKKLVLASIIMMGITGVATAQNSEALKAKKAASKIEANKPVLSNAAGVEAKVAPSETKSADVLLAEKQAKAVPDAAKPTAPQAKKAKQK